MTPRRLVVAALVVVAFLAGARGLARARLFPTAEVERADVPPDLVPTIALARDGAPVRMLEAPRPHEHAKTVVYFHNNRETVESRSDLARALRLRGLGAVLVEYRGYGWSAAAGTPTEEGLYLDAEAALDALSSRGIGPADVVLWGASLGTGVAAEMARRGRGSRLVLVTPYTSIPDLVPVPPLRPLVADRFDTIAKASSIAMPTLVVHGDEDEIVPFEMGARIARALPKAELVVVRGGRHGDLFARDAARIYDAVTALAR
jgi:alpha-beta hydrolase superfamily lysophospholipase